MDFVITPTSQGRLKPSCPFGKCLIGYRNLITLKRLLSATAQLFSGVFFICLEGRLQGCYLPLLLAVTAFCVRWV